MIYAAIYRLGLGLYAIAIRIAALFNHKARLFVTGRRGLLPAMRSRLAAEERQRIWVHCASLGEFEQGRPLIEALRARYPQHAIVLTFFSPSGYEVRKDYDGADYVCYLPLDTGGNARAFLDIVRPVLCLFIKYELWYFYLSQIAARRLPAILVPAVFHKDQGFFRWYGGLQRHMLRCFSHIFVQNEASVALLKSINIQNVSVSGDTRLDRVIRIAAQHESLPVAAAFAAGNKIIVAGSTWPADEQFLHQALALLPPAYKLILVPHEVNAGHIAEIEKLYAGDIIKWSAWHMACDKRVLLVDTVGLLSQLYRYGAIAWIGGGFGKDGVHNVPEAAVYGVPCFFGPVFHQFIEAQQLVAHGGAATVSRPEAFAAAVTAMENTGRYQHAAAAARQYVLAGAGATDRVMAYIDSLKTSL